MASFLGFSVRAVEAADQVRFVCSFQNDFEMPIFVQNLYGPPVDVKGLTIGGGWSPNDPPSKDRTFSTSTACLWPDEDAILIFQGEVATSPKITNRPWPNPGYTALPLGESHYEIAFRLPARQWENNVVRPAGGKTIHVTRVHVCVELLVAPLVVHREGLAIACDLGQPGYVADTVELQAPIVCVVDPRSPRRAAQQRLALGASVDLGNVRLGIPPASTPYVPPIQPPRRKSKGARLV